MHGGDAGLSECSLNNHDQCVTITVAVALGWSFRFVDASPLCRLPIQETT